MATEEDLVKALERVKSGILFDPGRADTIVEMLSDLGMDKESTILSGRLFSLQGYVTLFTDPADTTSVLSKKITLVPVINNVVPVLRAAETARAPSGWPWSSFTVAKDDAKSIRQDLENLASIVTQLAKAAKTSSKSPYSAHIYRAGKDDPIGPSGRPF